jgi:hypothetical protein
VAHTVAQVGIARRGHVLGQVLVLDLDDPQEAVPLEVGPELGLRAAGIVAGGLPPADGVAQPGVVGQIDPGTAVVLVDARTAVPAVVGIGGADGAAVVQQGNAIAALVVGVGHHLGRALGDGLALAGDPGERHLGERAPFPLSEPSAVGPASLSSLGVDVPHSGHFPLTLPFRS